MSRRMPRRSRLSRPQWAISIALALAAIGFVGAAQWNSSLVREEFVTSAQRVLTIEAQQLQREQERLRAEIEEAEDRVQTFQERDEGSQSALDMLNQQLNAARLAAGLQTVRGPGVVIEIADSQRPIPNDYPRKSDYIVLVDDLRDIVTALWASGAEGIAITGGASDGAPEERLVVTSSIYGVGSAILVNTAPLSPPYRIEAIGPDGLLERFLTNRAFLTRVARRIDAFGLQFAHEARDEVTLQGFIGTTQFRWGVPIEADN